MDLAAMPADEAVGRLALAARQIGSRAILIPTTDAAAIFASENAEALRDSFLFPRLAAPLVRTLYNKWEMQLLAEKAGVPTPRTFFPRSNADALSFLDLASLPFILKAIDDRRLREQGGRTKAIAHDRRELMELYSAMQDPESPNLVLQEYIPGGAQDNWMFNGYFNRDSRCLFGITGAKIRQFPVRTGPTTLGVCLPNPRVHQTTLGFMQAIGYQGILDLGYRYDRRDGLYKVYDVNPRIGSTFRLFVSDTGMDVARALYLDLTGQPVCAGAMVPGRRWMVEDLDLAASAVYHREGTLGLRDWIRSFHGLRETSFLALDDPLPILAMCLSDLGELFRHWRRLGPSVAERAARPAAGMRAGLP